VRERENRDTLAGAGVPMLQTNLGACCRSAHRVSGMQGCLLSIIPQREDANQSEGGCAQGHALFRFARVDAPSTIGGMTALKS
jgi:hypothetical protein